MTAKSDMFRLETPSTIGFRAGMSSSGVIGRKLVRVYDLPTDTPREIGDLLQVLDRKLCRAN